MGKHGSLKNTIVLPWCLKVLYQQINRQISHIYEYAKICNLTCTTMSLFNVVLALIMHVVVVDCKKWVDNKGKV